ncbi:iron uptake system protein EfeO [Corynebacterium bovis]|uniref:Peptidase M75 n=1 Tax=Corynebacterium bovis TaxID=36808 RepID=A0A3R8R4K7_9CORY|nr:iron uptake system protein EfeO [Corynebacterium bovis]RRO91062.1 peptidase M75 [Corynebacterium bovis]RRO95404.1 peptidase M75 [Corynebacterium bovis]RRQ00239.1 peptidase M75 [Corynebacterium bovis]RRQ01390.1 peptidase M75 [Corynebacterium bovis]RRQ03151.1 peptidase M75 [Corynebacterium bovis]
MTSTVHRSRALLALPVLAAVPLALVACADKEPAGGSGSFTVAASDDACTVSGSSGTTGNNTFEVTNSGSKVTEFYVYTQGGRVMGEVENIGPGATRKLVVELPEAATYRTVCKPGMIGDGIGSDFTVTGDRVSAADSDDTKAAAVKNYLTYVRTQTSTLDAQVGDFVAAIDAGDVAKAKSLYGPTRTAYERIEPIAEAFPDDLDPRIDAREADLEDGQTWTGFHTIEKQLWVDGAITDRTKADAAQLQKDVKELVDGVSASDFTVSPALIASGAQGLLDEIATSKITGEEDTFSHTDLWDFQANIAGSKAAIASLEEVLDARDPQLLKDINSRFADVQKMLDGYRSGDGFVSYDTVTEPQRKELSTALDALSERVTKVQDVVAQ